MRLLNSVRSIVTGLVLLVLVTVPLSVMTITAPSARADAVDGSFLNALKSKQITFTDAEFSANQDWMRDGIRYEFLLRAFNKKVANQSARQTDAEVLQAIQSMPKAESLLKDSNRAYAMRAAK